ncbi:uncharacterized protein LOC128134170 [Lactuca sativa]|uniref:uncharacterized protein LOC128134170 n=1 Tax=Lactuca sativa TaxID=4236 RepID=UPI0022AEB12B|nr:uncharacterized protein LOC128134170 [Lactuca sativa]
MAGGATDPPGGSEKDDQINFDDPLYIHPSDNVVTSIITTKLTDDSKKTKWDRANAVVCSWLLSSISDSIYQSQAYYEVAQDIWENLFETYNKSDRSVVFNIHQQINSFKQNGMYLSDYFNKLDSLWKEFDGLTSLTKCTCDASIKLKDHSNLMKLMQFLSGHDDSYSQVKSHILLMDPLPNVKTAFSIVSREESLYRNCSLTSLQSSQSVTKSQFSAFNSRFNSRNNNKNKSQIVQCKNCGVKGHTIEKCFKLIGYPKDFKSRSETNNQNNFVKIFSANSTTASSGSTGTNNFSDSIGDSEFHQPTKDQYVKLLQLIGDRQVNEEASASANMAGTCLFKAFNTSVNSKKWIVDSGANQHMIASESLLHDTVDVSKLELLVSHPNGTSAKIDKIGNMNLSSSLTLFDVFTVPDFNVNLLYVHKDLQSKVMVGNGRESGDLYYINSVPSDSTRVESLRSDHQLDGANADHNLDETCSSNVSNQTGEVNVPPSGEMLPNSSALSEENELLNSDPFDSLSTRVTRSGRNVNMPVRFSDYVVEDKLRRPIQNLSLNE